MKIIKEKRKSLSLRFDKSGELILKTPRFVSNKFIEEFLEKHKKWILEKRELIGQKIQKFEIGEKFLFFGEYFELKYKENIKFDFDFKYFYTSEKNPENIKKLFIKFYKKEAKKYLQNRILELSNILNIEFNNLKITSASSRWGSCTSKKNINLSFRLILTPKDCIDYVIIHEFGHLKEMNHSQNFWRIVNDYSGQIGLLNYKIYRNKLKDYNIKTNF